MAEKNFKITGGLALGDYALTANALALLWDGNAIASESYVDTAVAGATVNVDSLVGTGLFNDSGELAVNTNVIATKEYVDSVAQGLDVKASVKAATTENIDLGFAPGAFIDGVANAVGARFLFKNQTTTSENGIYIFDGSAFVRAADADTTADFNKGAFTFVESGTHAGQGFVVTAAGTLGTDAITWAQFSEAGSLTAGSNIYLDAGSINVNVNSLAGTLAGSGLYVSSNQLAVNVNALVGDLDANGYLKAVSGEVTLPGSGDFTITSSENIVLNSGAGKTAYLEDAAVAGNEIATKSYVDGIVNTNAIAGSLASSTLYVSDGDNLNVNVNAFVDTIDGLGLYVNGVTLAVNTNAIVGNLDGLGLYVDGVTLAVNTNALAGTGLVSTFGNGTISLDQYAAGVRYDGTSAVTNGKSVKTDTWYGFTATSNTYGTVGDTFEAGQAFTFDILMRDNDNNARKSIVSGFVDTSGNIEYTEYAIVDSATPLTAADVIVESVSAGTYNLRAKATFGGMNQISILANAVILDY
jgi:hypothetical protein